MPTYPCHSGGQRHRTSRGAPRPAVSRVVPPGLSWLSTLTAAAVDLVASAWRSPRARVAMKSARQPCARMRRLAFAGGELYLEQLDPHLQTFASAGHYGIDFYYQAFMTLAP